MIEGHGDDIFRYGGKVRVNFSTNIPQSVDHSGLMAHLAAKGDIFRNYPEPTPGSVERKLARMHGVRPENVLVANGATEIIYLIAHAYRSGRSAILSPTFTEYQDACRMFGHSVSFMECPEEMPEGMDTVWICNPNNPTGEVIERGLLLSVIDAHPQTLFVVDQAYASYSVKEVAGVADVMERVNVVMLQSLTKQFVVPGLRIGYAIGSGEVLGRLRGLLMPWSVSSIAIEAAHYLLDHAASYSIDSVTLHSEALRLAERLRACGMTVSDTDCNFILARLPHGEARELKEGLVERYGLLIRDASNFEGLTPQHFRVAAQTSGENDLLINAIEEWISSYR